MLLGIAGLQAIPLAGQLELFMEKVESPMYIRTNEIILESTIP